MAIEHPSAWVRHRVFGRMRNRGLVLLIALLLQLVMYPLITEGDSANVSWIVAYWLATPLLGVVQLASRWWMIVVAALCVAVIAILALLDRVAVVSIPGEVIVLLGTAIYLSAAIAIGRAALFSHELVDNRLYAGFSAYLLIGYFFAAVHHWVWLRDPLAYQISGEQGPANLHIADFIYFSFSTLTTAGFGDIIAVSRGARLTCMLEAVTGILMPATFIARLLAQQVKKSA
jgi:hypothetical protein